MIEKHHEPDKFTQWLNDMQRIQEVRGLHSPLADAVALDGVVVPTMRQLFARHRPKLGLQYLTGVWLIPWVIHLRWFSSRRRDTVKAKIAARPRSDLALAYAMGVVDGENDKATVQGEVTAGRSILEHRLKTVDETWLKTRGLLPHPQEEG